MSLVQMFWQWRDGKLEMKAERVIASIDEMQAFVEDCWKEYPPPDGAMFLAVNVNPE